MARAQQLSQDIFFAIASYPDGLSAEEISSLLKPPPARRTLQRRLLDLIEAGRIEKHGEGRGTHYQLPPLHQPLTVEYPKEAYITLSDEGQAIQTYVNQPIEKRRRVNYHPKFLSDYQPDHTFYLPKAMRDTLKRMAVQPDGKQPAGSFAKKILHELLIDLSWNSSRLEGNSYSLLETKQLIESGKIAKRKSTVESQMIINHKAAIEYLVHNSHVIGFNPHSISDLHALLSVKLLEEDRYCGQLRNTLIGIGKSAYQPLQIPQRIQEYFALFLKKAEAIHDPLEQSFFAMVHIPYLQAFLDVNKRTSRLAANIPLIKNNLSPISFIDVPTNLYVEGILGVYELNQIALLRDLFFWAYKRSCARYSLSVRNVTGEPDPLEVDHYFDIQGVVKDVIQQKMTQQKATEFIQAWAKKNIEEKDDRRIVEMIESDLLSLHEGNCVCFCVTREEFHAWKKIWELNITGV